MNIGFFSSTYLSGLIMPSVYRTGESLIISLVNRFCGYSVDYQEGTITTHMIVDWRVLTRCPANRNQLVMLRLLDYVSLITVIGVADASLECGQINLEVA